MSPKKKISKKELKQDELKIAFMSLLEYYNANKKKINYIIFAIGAVFVVGLLIRISIVSMNKSAAEYYQTGMESYTKAQEANPAPDAPEPAQKPEDQLRAAKESFQTVVNTYSHSKVYRMSLLMLANTDFQLGNYDDALKTYETFIAKTKKSALAIQGLVGKAYVLERKGQIPEALQVLESLLNGPFDYYFPGELYLDLARLYEASNNSAKALEYYQLFEKEYPESRRISVVKEKIATLAS